MALQKHIVRMSAEGGLDTKTDEKNVLSTNLLALENAVFTKTGAFTKRFGYLAYTNNVLSSVTAITSGKAATIFKDELLRYTSDKLYSYSNAEDKWVNRGPTRFALSQSYGITTNGDKLLNPSHATVSNLTCYVYERNSIINNAVEYRLIDNVTGSVIYTGTISSAARPQVYTINGKFFIIYYDGGNVKFRAVTFSTPDQISASTTIVAATHYNAEKIGNRVYVVSPDTTGLNVSFINEAGTVNGPFGVSDAGTYDTFSISAEQTSLVRIVYGRASGSSRLLKTVLYAADLNYQIHAPLQLSADTLPWNIGSIQDPSSTNCQIYVSDVTAAPYKTTKYVVTAAGALSSSSTFLYQASLQSKPQVLDSKVYMAVAKNSSIISGGSTSMPFRTMFMVSEDGDFLTKFGEEVAVFRAAESLPNLNVEGDKLCFSVPEASEIQANLSTTVVLVPTAVKKYAADFSTLNNYFDSSLGDNLHIAGGILKMYDGNQVVEHGFLQIPEAPVFVSETATGAVLPNGTYQYILVYRWTDKWGQVHRSAPSLPLSYTVSAGPKKPTIKISTLPFTSKTNVEMEIYRTEANGTTFYKRSHNYADRIYNDKTVESISFTDTTADDELIGSQASEILYTDGGVLENTAADSSKFVSTYKGRLILLLSDGYTLQYSKKRGENGPVEFAAELKQSLDHEGGPAICTAVMDDYVIIFKERAIFAFTGEGPNSLGEQDDFRQPYLITSDCGCIDPNSVVLMPEGLMFKGSKGIYILRRGFASEYIGAPVEAYNDLTITSATLIPNTNEVRFTTSGDKALVYDYFHKKWTTFTNINAVDATIYNSKYIYLREDGSLMEETKGLFSDNGSYITMKLESSWVQLQATANGLASGGLQGFERFYKMLILGSYKNKHLLRVKFAYDFNPAWLHEANVDAGDILDPETYGTGVFGSETTYGGEFPLYQFRIFPKRQKCEAFKFCIEDFKTDGNGESLSLSNFAAEVGLKPPLYKRGSGESFGAA